MGSATIGYEYEYRFWVDDDIIHRCSCVNIRDDIKFLFEIRTNFRVRDSESDDVIIIDGERFERIGAENCSEYLLSSLMEDRLVDDYWFTLDECKVFTREASAFAAAADIEQTMQPVIPIAVEMDVCTVRQTGESMAEANDRAIRSEKLRTLLTDTCCPRCSHPISPNSPHSNICSSLSKEKLFSEIEQNLMLTKVEISASAKRLDKMMQILARLRDY